jgi:hypothetical protein
MGLSIFLHVFTRAPCAEAAIVIQTMAYMVILAPPYLSVMIPPMGRMKEPTNAPSQAILALLGAFGLCHRPWYWRETYPDYGASR